MTMPARKRTSPPLPNNFHVSEHPLIGHKLALMRNRTTTSQQFYTLMKEVGMLMTYEVTRRFETIPAANGLGETFAGKKPALVPILRSGLALAEGMREIMPAVRIGHLGLLQDEHHHTQEYLIALPEVNERTFIVLDAVIETGNAAIRAIEILTEEGVKQRDIIFTVIFSTNKGAINILKRFPDVNIYASRLGEFEADKHSSLGSRKIGDRLFFGIKG